jgi:hypothetical protein
MHWVEQFRTSERELAKAMTNGDSSRQTEIARQQLALFWTVSRERIDPEPDDNDTDFRRLYESAHQTIAQLGGQGEPVRLTLADYDHERYGPILGVSDEGSATAAIRHGATASPKCHALANKTPFTIGAAHDAERLGAVGEIVVGPDEFATIRLACHDRMLTTTNVGTRVNIRNFVPPPIITIRPGSLNRTVGVAAKKLAEIIAPFVMTASGRARSCTVFVRFAGRISPDQQLRILKRLQDAAASNSDWQPRLHRLALAGMLTGNLGRAVQAKRCIALASQSGISEVGFEGSVLASTAANISESGLLNILKPAALQQVLKYAAKKKIDIGPLQRVDPQTTARHIWTGLAIARNMGFELGKYGLVPLTFAQQREVIARIQYWFKGWSAAPVYFVDYPLVTENAVFHGPTLADGIREWLKMVGQLHVRVVLIDTAKKSEHRHLVRESRQDKKGFLSFEDIASLSAFAASLGIKVLWAGSISLSQAFEFGRMGVFGVYVTSATTAPRPVDKHARRDPALLVLREPQADGVARVKLLLEAGFLARQKKGAGKDEESATITQSAHGLLKALSANQSDEIKNREVELHRLVTIAWREWLHAAMSK